MSEKRKVIILDMDNTLEAGDYGDDYKMMMTVRPHIKELIEKLKDAKKLNIDVLLCTTAKQPWVDRFLKLEPEFVDIFDRMLTRDNEEEWKHIIKSKNPVEYDAYMKDSDIGNGKPVTTLGYDSILFIDDGKIEGDRLKRLFTLAGGNLDRDVTFFSGYGFFNPGAMSFIERIALSKYDDELKKMLVEFLQVARDENGCLIMCDVIDDFIKKEYEKGLTLADDKYQEKYDEYHDKLNEIDEKIFERGFEVEEEHDLDTWELTRGSDGKLKDEYVGYFLRDRHQVLEGLDALLDLDDRAKLEDLIKTAVEKETAVEQASGLLSEYQQLDDTKGEKRQKN